MFFAFLAFRLSFGGGVYAAKTGKGHADAYLVFSSELFREICSGASPLSAKPEGFSARPKGGGTIFLLLQKDPKSSRGAALRPTSQNPCGRDFYQIR